MFQREYKMKGTIKFFTNGYGFIAYDGKPDLFVHISAVNASGFSDHDMVKGNSIEFEVGKSPKDDRPCAASISKIDGNGPSQAPKVFTAKLAAAKPKSTSTSKPRRDDKPQLPVGYLGIGTVTVFKDDKNYGFMASADNSKADAFLHINDVPDEYPDPEVGHKLPFRIVEDNGRMKAVVLLGAEAIELGLIEGSSTPVVETPAAQSEPAPKPAAAKAKPAAKPTAAPKPKSASARPPAPSRQQRLADAGKLLSSAAHG